MKYVFTFKAKRRSKPNPKYNGILKTHRFYIEYYTLLDGQDPEKLENTEPKISFPVRFMETVLDFAKELEGEIVKIRKVKPPKAETSYKKPVVVLLSELTFRRHLLFTLVASTYRKPEKLNTLRNLVLNLNANFLNILTNMAMERYSELRNSSNPAWLWYMLRVGRAVKVLYRID